MANRRNPPLKFTLPDVIDPPDRICFQVNVPNNIYHIGAFRGALMKLASAIFWADDAAHTAKDVALVWRDVYDNVRICPDCPDGSGNSGITLEDFMSQQIRKKPENPCIIQMWCIDEWVDWYDPTACVPGSIRQQTNGEPIVPGSCREWDVLLDSRQKWLLPVAVNSGDIITITDTQGATNDGTLLIWDCADGQNYLLGICSGGQITGVSDPAPDVYHQRLIANIDGTYYDAFNQVIAVPTGVSDGQVEFQINTETLSANSGSISFHVKVCVASVSYALTPAWGTGPSIVTPGQEFVWTSQLNGSFYQLTFSCDPCIPELTLVSLTGWSVYASGGASVYGYHDCSNTLHGFNYPGTTTVPTPQTTEALDWAIFSATPFSAVFRVGT